MPIRSISTSPKLRFFSPSTVSAIWMSNRFTMNTPKSRCSHSSASFALNITLRIAGSVKISLSRQQQLCALMASTTKSVVGEEI